MKVPKFPKVDLPRIAAWVELARSIAALLFIPAVCVYAIGLVFLMRDFAIMGPESVRLHVVDHFGFALYGLIALVGLGVLWLQKRDIPDFNIVGPGGFSVGVTNNNPEPTTTVETTTSVEIK